MKLRFGIDATLQDRIHATLNGLYDEPPVGRRLSYIDLDSPGGALAATMAPDLRGRTRAMS